MHRLGIAALGVVVGLLAGAGAGAAPTDGGEAARVQAALEDWLAARATAEGVTGIAAYVSLADPGPAIEAFAGRTGRAAGDPPVDQDTLFQMGSTSKSFAAAVILQLEAAGRLSLDDTVGKWLPEYPAWGEVSIRRLLNMTAGLPNYSETEAMSKAWIDDPARDMTPEALLALAYPSATVALPVPSGYFYSNTNYILAGLIAAKAGGKPYAELVREMVIEPFGLHSTFFDPGTYPPEVRARLAHGYFESDECAGYQPDCTESWNKPLIGRDMRDDSVSWAQAAGGAISNARDVDRWMRAVFGGKVVPPKQQAEWLEMVSVRTGEPLPELTPEDPQGFSLGLGQGLFEPYGKVWFYQGETLGYRTLYVWFEADDMLVTVQTNSQADADENRLRDAVIAIHEALAKP